MDWHNERWKPSLDWTTPSGELLLQAVQAIPNAAKSQIPEIVIFGSSPLQMGISSAITSGDLDIATDSNLERVLTEAKLTKAQRSPYVEVCPLNTFRTAPDWRSRAYTESVSGISLVFPHPIDILVSKVRRCEEKDIESFYEVIRSTGHPTEDELRKSLKRAVDIYKPGFDESSNSDPIFNTGVLWERPYGKTINVREEIIIPGNQERMDRRRGPLSFGRIPPLKKVVQESELDAGGAKDSHPPKKDGRQL